MSSQRGPIDLHAHLAAAGPRDWQSYEHIIAAMDEARIARRVLSIVPSQEADPPLVKALNDALAELVTRDPARIGGFASLSHGAIDDAPQELRRAVVELGLSGAVLDSHFGGAPWDEEAAEPLFATAEELGAVLFFHSSTTLVAQRMDRYGVPDTIGPQLESTAVAASLLLGGVLARHPNLKALIAHGGGFAIFGIGRMDRGWTVRREARRAVRVPPSDYLDRLYFDSLTWDDRALRYLVDSVGADHVVLGSDWADPLAEADASGRVERNPHLTGSEKAQITGLSGAALLGSA